MSDVLKLQMTTTTTTRLDGSAGLSVSYENVDEWTDEILELSDDDRIDELVGLIWETFEDVWSLAKDGLGK